MTDVPGPSSASQLPLLVKSSADASGGSAANLSGLQYLVCQNDSCTRRTVCNSRRVADTLRRRCQMLVPTPDHASLADYSFFGIHAHRSFLVLVEVMNL